MSDTTYWVSVRLRMPSTNAAVGFGAGQPSVGGAICDARERLSAVDPIAGRDPTEISHLSSLSGVGALGSLLTGPMRQDAASIVSQIMPFRYGSLLHSDVNTTGKMFASRGKMKLKVIGRGVMAGLLGVVLIGCDDGGPAAEAPVRPVRVTTVEERAAEQRVTLSGQIEAQTEVSLGFRIGGRIVERLVDVGEQVTAGQLLARLDPSDEENALRSARAALSAAESQLVEASGNYDRQAQLLDRGFTTRQRFDEALRGRLTAQAQSDSAAAQLEIALTRVADTELRADASGSVTARGAEAGEVVQPGAMVVRIARDGGRDAIFDAPETLLRTAPRNPEVAVALSLDPSVVTTGRVREVAPSADALTGTFRVRVGLDAPPEAMRLGSIVTGSVVIGGAPGMALPATALTRADGAPAVWVVDPATDTVSLRAVDVSRYGPGEVVLSGGVAPGDIVVTAGVQALRPGQQVRVPGAGS